MPWAAEATDLVDLASHIRALQPVGGNQLPPGSSYPSCVWAARQQSWLRGPVSAGALQMCSLQYGWLPARSSMLCCMQRNRKGVMKATTETAIVLTGARHCARVCVMVMRPLRIKWHTGGCLVDGSGC